MLEIWLNEFCFRFTFVVSLHQVRTAAWKSERIPNTNLFTSRFVLVPHRISAGVEACYSRLGSHIPHRVYFLCPSQWVQLKVKSIKLYDVQRGRHRGRPTLYVRETYDLMYRGACHLTYVTTGGEIGIKASAAEQRITISLLPPEITFNM